MSVDEPDFDAQDLALLQALQSNARLTVGQLAEEIRLSSSPTWRRVKRLEAAGVVSGYHAMLDRRALGWGVLAFIAVSIEDHGDEAAKAFESAIDDLPQVVACWSVSGDSDFLLQVVAQDLDGYADFAMTTVRRLPGIKAMRTVFTLKEIKAQTNWPLPRRSSR